MDLSLRRLTAAVFLLMVMAAPVAAQDGSAAKELQILRITPEGKDAPATRQIVVEFNRPVVPVGRMDRTADEVGITMTPPVECQWRWLNSSALSCNLTDKTALSLATTYNVKVEPKITAEDGAMLTAPYDHKFTTARAGIETAALQTWDSPGTPVYRLSFNQPVTRSSVKDHIYFEETENSNRIFTNVSQLEEDDSKPAIVDGEEARTLWQITPIAEMPLDSEIKLMQEPGLLSAEGPEASEETRTLQTFYTFPPFAFKDVICYNTDNQEIRISATNPQTDATLCNPMMPVRVSFTAPVLRSAVQSGLKFTPDLSGGRKDYNPWGDENRDWSALSYDRSSKDREYTMGLPVGLKAAQEYTISTQEKRRTFWDWVKSLFSGEKEIKTALTDEFGRSLPPFSLTFATGHRNPNYEMVYRDAVLEKGIDSDVPLYVNNLDNYSFDYQYLNATTKTAQADTSGAVGVPKVQDVQYAVPLGIRNMLKGKSGALFGYVSTTPSIEKWDGAGRLFAQVTPYQVYAKLGHFRSTVWVTDLATGKTVPDAAVTVYTGEMINLRAPTDALATAQTDADGLAVLPGTNTLDPTLSLSRSYQDKDTRLFIRVEKGEDMALLPVSYDYEVQLWNVSNDVYSNSTERYGHMKSWGMTAQGIYRAGDTMQYKIYIRDSDNDRFIAPPAGKYSLEITDPAGKSVEQKDVTVSPFGTVEGEYTIPKSAAVGWYSFKLTALLKGTDKNITKEFWPLSVLVSDFTPAPFRVSTELNGDHFKAGDKLDITTNARLHSGGGYGDAAVRSTITLKSRAFNPSIPIAQGFEFDSFNDERDTEELQQKEDRLNDKGDFETSFTLPEKQIVYGELRVESAVRDDRGKSIANEARATYVGVDRLVGLKPAEWVFMAKKPSVINTLVVDDKGVPTQGISVNITIEKEQVATAKVKSAGSAYTNDNTVEWTKTSSCKVRSSDSAATPCEFTPPDAGSYRAVATIKDTKGREHITTTYLWVTGDDYVQWNEGREYALTLLPEKTDYKVGDTARFLLKNPYPGATAYISVERYGVIDNFVKILDSSAPVIEIPVKPDYVPGFYLSVVLVSPRVDAPPPELGQIDMGKPTFRVGYVKVPVIDTYKEMAVTAKASAEEYRPRDKVTIDLTAAPKHEGASNQPIELAVAVLDESVFDLIQGGRDAFDPYKGFYDLDALDVSNYSLMTRLIGRQKFEKKGANAGGDGGVDEGMRNLFKFVSYWNPSVPVDSEGKAKIEFDAPDNLTGWHVLAIATTKDDLMGLGEGTFKVNRPTEIRPVMPNQVREGDAFEAGFSVMNRTDAARDITVKITASGDIDGKPSASHEEKLRIEPYKRVTILMPLKAALLPISRDVPDGEIAFRVSAGDDADTDSVEHSLSILKSRTYDTAATYAISDEDSATQTIVIPKDIYTDSGEISVALSPSVIANLDGAFRYMRDYTYPCWEQKLSVAAMAAQYKNLEPYLSVEWQGVETLTNDIVSTATEYQAPNGGMGYFRGADEYADPYLSAYTALVFQWLKQDSYQIPVNVETKLHIYLLNFLRGNTAPEYYNDVMISTVRAVILDALSGTGKVTKDDILRFKTHVKGMGLFGKAHYLSAAQRFPELQSVSRDTLGMILSSGIESGGKFSFNETYDNGYSRILATPLRDNCVILDTLLDYPDSDLIGDKPFKLVRMVTQARGNRDHWENTQENMFCMKALSDYAKKYESNEPDMIIKAALDNAEFGAVEFSGVKDAPVTLEKPLEDLEPDSNSILSLTREGQGRYYYNTRLRYALKDPADLVNAGIDVRREYSIRQNGKWQLVNGPLKIQRGDLVKIDLFVSLPTARSFVVVNDPLPGGLETVNRDLATASNIDADQDLFDEAGGSYWFKHTDWQSYNASRWSFYHKELRHDSARFYADWLTPGNYHLSYMAQAVATGNFAIPATMAEEMYDPDVYGRGVKGQLIVQENR